MENLKNKFSLNTTIDYQIFKEILRKSWYWCVLFGIMVATLAFLFLRYTQPIYKANALIQIKDEDRGAEVFGFSSFNQSNIIAKELELLRSSVLFSQAIEKLPLNVTYYAKGDVLTEHRYRHGNFFVDVINIKDSSLFDVPIYLKDGKALNITFRHRGKEYEYAIDTNSVLNTPFFAIKLRIPNPNSFKEDIKKNQLYFKLTSISAISQKLRPGLKVNLVDRSAQTIEISYEGRTPSLAYDIVASVIDEFVNYDENSKKESSKKILEFIEYQLDSLTKELTQSKNDIMLFQQSENITNPDRFSLSLTERVEELRKAEREVLDELRVLNKVDAKLAESRELESVEVYRLIPNIVGKSYGQTLGLQINELYHLVEQKEDLLYKVTPDNELITKIDKRIQVRKESIKGIIETLIKEAGDKIAIISDEINAVEAKYFSFPEKQMELSRLVNIKDLNEKYFTELTEKKVMYSISIAGYISETKILNPASIPSHSIYPKKSIVYAVSFFLFFLFSLVFLLIRYLLYNEIIQLSDISGVIAPNVNVLGSVPDYGEKSPHSKIVVSDSLKTVIGEHFRILRTNLSFIDKRARTISVTSTVSGEGKTFVALNLSAIISLTDKKVVLIDLDMRKPTVHLGLDKHNQLGISNVLAGHCELNEVIQTTEFKNLDFISAGALPPNPSELILSKKLDETIETLKDDYDIIVIDSPPAGLVTDAIQIVDKVDVPIYVFRSGYSKRQFVNKLNELASKKGVRSINVVLNGVNTIKRSNYRGYGSYYTNE